MERCLFALLQPVPATNDGAVFEMVANALVTKRGQVPICPRFPQPHPRRRSGISASACYFSAARIYLAILMLKDAKFPDTFPESVTAGTQNGAVERVCRHMNENLIEQPFN